jgi:hypothetical protein
VPFTVSHAVVALPFVRSPLSYGAVAVGAMTPDLPLFFPGVAGYGTTHGFPGVVLVSLPIAVVLYAVWRLLLRPAAPRLLPRTVGSRFPAAWAQARVPALRDVPPIVVALAIGIATHVLWDSFTHPGRLGSVLVPGLATTWGPLPGTQWLQYASSVGGLVLVAIVGLRHLIGAPRSTVAALPRVRAAFGSAVLLACAAGVIVTFLETGIPTDLEAFRGFAFSAGTRAGAGILLAAVAAAVAALLAARPLPVEEATAATERRSSRFSE